jgi:hypothetical protein
MMTSTQARHCQSRERLPAISPLVSRTNHIYVAYADKGQGTDKADVFLRRSADGGDTWGDCGQVSTVRSNDQWMPVMCIKPDGSRLSIAWYERRDDPNNSLIHVYGRWATLGTDGSVNWGIEFRISTQGFPQVFAGISEIAHGAYDPVYPPGDVAAGEQYSLAWYADWQPHLSQANIADSYAKHVGEYNGAWATADAVCMSWADGRGLSVGTLLQRHHMDIRFARMSWP